MRKKLAIATVAAAALGALVVGVVSGKDGSSLPKVNLSVFKTPQRQADRLPVAFLDKNAVITHHFRNANSRRVGTYRGVRWWAVPGLQHTICLAGLNKQGETFGPCSDSSTLQTRPIVFGYATGKDQDGDHVILAGLANDGITRITVAGRSARVRRNAFFLTVPEGRYTLRATGPHTTRTMPLPLGQ